MIVTIHQPDFMPWLGFFDRWQKSDLLILLDDVQFIRRGWHHRDRIKTAQGAQWLTVPVRKKGRFNQTITEAEIDNSNGWRKKHLGMIRAAYALAPEFEQVFSGIESIYAKEDVLLMDLNRRLLKLFSDRLDIKTPVARSSSWGIEKTGTDRLVRLCEAVQATHYFTGVGSKGYLDEQAFKNAGIEVLWQDFNHPVYPQLHGPFISNLSALDYIMMTACMEGS